jgi:hypothetical protein
VCCRGVEITSAKNLVFCPSLRPLLLWITLWVTGLDTPQGPEIPGPATDCSKFRHIKIVQNQRVGCM